MQLHQSHTVYVCIYASTLKQEDLSADGCTHMSEVESYILCHGHLGIISLVEGASMTNINRWRSSLKQTPYTTVCKECADKMIQALGGRVCVIRAVRMVPSAARVFSEDDLDFLVDFP